ncbi:MAG: hypothetical protein COU07_02695 [Candidatus Harrisonbacteria bacterium CG10_big_fil_rev_8_21_14_0_10_40_38]|uniref:Glutamyl-tRNA amidotransferase n=1 Tax=Candidatus Harrisonbacteria bacterium CG10_big_fil_rev_8_21_14_0_10_40_38 TaxID=1974583 RepID=A0A2H0URX2_9BACT|nr:MAG: hypothetical protein COU07_02695 [Candidatus Harrisonbacteria bacterium CG10_big_fil_rev_8_21_14_0_10_40_38]
MTKTEELISSNLKDAMRSGDSLTVNVLRLVQTAIKNRQIEKRTKGEVDELTEDEIQAILRSEAKKRKEASDMYEKAGHKDRMESEQKELAVLKNYLPKQIEGEELEKMISGIIEKENLTTFNDAIKKVMSELRGRADEKRIVEIIKNILG